MLSNPLFAVLAGTILGTLSGLGIGGGSLLILWLTAVVGTPQQEARCINLLFFLPSALIATLLRRKSGNLPVSRLIPAILFGSAAAAAFSLIGRNLDLQILRRLFGMLLLATGLREVFYRPRNAR